MISIKRVYEPAKQTDGTRFLVDHLWPRGVKKESVKIERWVERSFPVMHCENGLDTNRKSGRNFNIAYFAA